MKRRIRLTESKLRQIVKESVKRAVNEANGFVPNANDYHNSMFYSHDIPSKASVSDEQLSSMVHSYKMAVDRLLSAIHDIEYTGVENFEQFYDVLRRNCWNDFANDKI